MEKEGTYQWKPTEAEIKSIAQVARQLTKALASSGTHENTVMQSAFSEQLAVPMQPVVSTEPESTPSSLRKRLSSGSRMDSSRLRTRLSSGSQSDGSRSAPSSLRSRLSSGSQKDTIEEVPGAEASVIVVAGEADGVLCKTSNTRECATEDEITDSSGPATVNTLATVTDVFDSCDDEDDFAVTGESQLGEFHKLLQNGIIEQPQSRYLMNLCDLARDIHDCRRCSV